MNLPTKLAIIGLGVMVLGSRGNRYAPCVADCGAATRYPFCARERGRACLFRPIFCAFAPKNTDLSAQQSWRNVAYRQRRGKPYTCALLSYAMSGKVMARATSAGP